MVAQRSPADTQLNLPLGVVGGLAFLLLDRELVSWI
jgi:hypothetical protein